LFLLPLLFLPGLERPFSTPKLWLLLPLAVLHLRAAFHPVWLVWPGAVALSALTAPYASLEALLLAVLPLPLALGSRHQPILVASAVESAIVVLQYAGLDPLRLTGWQPETFPGERMRVYGTLGNPNFAAAWLCTTLPLYLGKGRIWALAAALQAGAIFATGSRVFLLALPAAALALPRRKWALAALPVAAALVWLSPARPLDVTVEGRLYIARVTAAHLAEIPLTGYGPGSFRLKFAEWQVQWFKERGPEDSTRRFAGPVDHAHNDYLEFWVEYGPAGLGAFLFLAGWLLWTALSRDPAALAGLTALAAVATVDFPFHRPAGWALFWLLIGLTRLGAVRYSDRRGPNPVIT
jgi:O-antigen ligase